MYHNNIQFNDTYSKLFSKYFSDIRSCLKTDSIKVKISSKMKETAQEPEQVSEVEIEKLESFDIAAMEKKYSKSINKVVVIPNFQTSIV